MEDAIVTIGADSQSLGVILEGIGRGLCALIIDLQCATLLEKLESGVGADAVNAPRGYIASDTEMAYVRLVAHTLKLADGDVVALVIADAREREIGDSREDHQGGCDDLERALLSCDRHMFLYVVYACSSESEKWRYPIADASL
jgi:hypothetical protein